MITETRQILDELKVIKIELDYIKKNMIDKDMLLTNSERKLLKESYKNEKEGKLIYNEEMRKLLA